MARGIAFDHLVMELIYYSRSMLDGGFLPVFDDLDPFGGAPTRYLGLEAHEVDWQEWTDTTCACRFSSHAARPPKPTIPVRVRVSF